MRLSVLWHNPLCISAALVGVLFGLIAAPVPMAAVGILFVGVLAAVVLTRPELVLLAMIAALPWENLLHYPSAQLSTVKGIGAALTLAYLLRLCGDRGAVIRLPRALGVATVLGIWIGLTLVFCANPSGGLEKFARWSLFLIFFFLIIQLVDGRAEIRRVLKVFTTSVAAAAGYTLFLFLGAHNGYRAAGPLEDPNDLAYLMACTIPIAAYLFKSDPRRRLAWGAAFALITAAMLATFSRGALVGLGALVLWGIFTRRIPFRAVAAGLIVGLIAVALAFTVWKPFIDVALKQKEHVAQSNIESREARWSAAIQLAGESPITGVGPGQYPREALPILRDGRGVLPSVTVPQTVTHNTYLEILAENGFPGLALFIAYLVTIWFLLRTVQRRAEDEGDDDERWLATAMQASFLVAIVAGTFLSEELTAPFWVIGGLAVVLARERVPAPAPAPDKPAVDGARAMRPAALLESPV
jgi:putative inorganic carbon (HCO3(-)) transporter